MVIHKTPQESQVLNGTTQFYRCFIKKIASIMAPIIKLEKLKCSSGLLNVKPLGKTCQEYVHSSSYIH
jgi:hypothetical protein